MKTMLTVIAAALALAAGCARSPDRYFYTLRTAASDQTAGTADRHPIRRVAISTLTIPESVDRNKIVTRKAGAARLEISEAHQWASPLTGEIAQVIADALAKDLHGALVTIPTQNSGLSGTDFQLDIDITRFEGTLGGVVDLDAMWAFQDQSASQHRHEQTHLTEKVNGQDYDALVTAYTAALKKLSRIIANGIEQPPAPAISADTVHPHL